MGHKALVLSGGGAKGAFELGAIDYLITDRQMNFDVLAGVSTGTLNAVMLAHSPGSDGLKASLETLKDIWLNKVRRNEDVYTQRSWGLLGIALGADSLYDFNPLSKLISKHVNLQAIQDSDRVLLFGVVELNSGKYFVVKKDAGGLKQIDPKEKRVENLSWERFLDYVLASATIPFAFPPVKDHQKRLVDGGVRNVTPVADAFDVLKELGESQEDEIYVVLASPLSISPQRTPLNNGLSIARRSVDILTNEVYENDLKMAAHINDAIKAHHDLKKKLMDQFGIEKVDPIFDQIPFPLAEYKYAKLTVIEPENEYMGTLEFEKEKIQQAFSAGREAAKRKLNGST